MAKARIIIVEDERIVARDIKMHLEKMGYAVCSMVSSGEAALERMERDLPDLVLIDIVLEGELDGIETAHQIRSRFDIPLVYLTSHAQEKLLERAKATGPFGYLLKPFQERELRATMEMALFKHQTDRELRTQIEERQRAQKELEDALQESEQRNLEVAALLEGARNVLRHQDFRQAARALFDVCRTTVGAASGYVAVMNPEGTGNEVLFLESGGLPCTVDPNLPMPIRGLREEAYNKGKTVYENDFNKSELVQWLPDGHVTLENVLFAPLLMDEKVVGIIGIANKPGGFNENDARVATAFGELAAIALRNSQTLTALRESEQQFKSLFDHIPSPAFVVDNEHRCLAFNQAASRCPRYQIGTRTLDLAGISDARKIWHRVEDQVIQSGGAAWYVEMVGPPHQDVAYHETRLRPIEDLEGNVSMIMGITEDITAYMGLMRDLDKARLELERRVEERTAELVTSNRQLSQEIEERKQAEQLLRQSEERYRRITQTITDYAYTVRVEDGIPLKTIHGAVGHHHARHERHRAPRYHQEPEPGHRVHHGHGCQ